VGDNICHVDGYTIIMITKSSHQGNLTHVKINLWFSSKDEEGNKKQRVFPGLSENQTKNVIKRWQERYNQQYRTFADIMNQQYLCLDEFYIVVEKIACWFSIAARLGYDGGGSIEHRNCTDHTL